MALPMKTLELDYSMIQFLTRCWLFNDKLCAQAEMKLIFAAIGYLNKY